jgi:pilus assembly protein CpaF
MLWSMSSGHDGSLSTCHASSGLDVLFRLETFVLLAGAELPLAAVRAQVRAAVDAVIGIVRLPDGRRVVREVSEVPPDPGAEHPRPLVRDGRLIGAPTRSRRWVER